MPNHHRNKRSNNRGKGRFPIKKRNHRHYQNKGRSNQTPMRPSAVRAPVEPPVAQPNPPRFCKQDQVPFDLLNIPNRVFWITVRLDGTIKEVKEIETQVETNHDSGNLTTTLKSTESYTKIFKLDDKGYQIMFNHLNNAQDLEDENSNASQMKLRLITQTCMGDAGKTMKEAQYVALDKMARVDGEVSIHVWKEEVNKAMEGLKKVYKKGKEQVTYTNNQKDLILRVARMEYLLIKTLYDQIKVNEEEYAGHKEEIDDVLEMFRGMIDDIYDDYSMQRNVEETLNEMEEDMEHFEHELKKVSGACKESLSDSSEFSDSSVVSYESKSSTSGSYAEKEQLNLEMANPKATGTVMSEKNLKGMTDEETSEAEWENVKEVGMKVETPADDWEVLETTEDDWEVVEARPTPVECNDPIQDDSMKDPMEDKKMPAKPDEERSENSSHTLRNFAIYWNGDDSMSVMSEKERGNRNSDSDHQKENMLMNKKEDDSSVTSKGSKKCIFDDKWFHDIETLSELGLSRLGSLDDLSILSDLLEDKLLQENMIGEEMKETSEEDCVMLEPLQAANKDSNEAQDNKTVKSFDSAFVIGTPKDQEIREKPSSESDTSSEKSTGEDEESVEEPRLNDLGSSLTGAALLFARIDRQDKCDNKLISNIAYQSFGGAVDEAIYSTLLQLGGEDKRRKRKGRNNNKKRRGKKNVSKKDPQTLWPSNIDQNQRYAHALNFRFEKFRDCLEDSARLAFAAGEPEYAFRQLERPIMEVACNAKQLEILLNEENAENSEVRVPKFLLYFDKRTNQYLHDGSVLGVFICNLANILYPSSPAGEKLMPRNPALFVDGQIVRKWGNLNDTLWNKREFWGRRAPHLVDPDDDSADQILMEIKEKEKTVYLDEILELERIGSKRRNNRMYHFGPAPKKKTKKLRFKTEEDDDMNAIVDGVGEIFNQEPENESMSQVSEIGASEKQTEGLINNLKELGKITRARNERIDSVRARRIIESKDHPELGEIHLWYTLREITKAVAGARASKTAENAWKHLKSARCPVGMPHEAWFQLLQNALAFMPALIDEDGKEGTFARKYTEQEVAERLMRSVDVEIYKRLNANGDKKNWDIKEAKERIFQTAKQMEDEKEILAASAAAAEPVTAVVSVPSFQDQRRNAPRVSYYNRSQDRRSHPYPPRSHFHPQNRHQRRDFGENQRRARNQGNGHYNRQPPHSYENHRNSNSNRSTNQSTVINHSNNRRNEHYMHERNFSSNTRNTQHFQFLGSDSDSI